MFLKKKKILYEFFLNVALSFLARVFLPNEKEMLVKNIRRETLVLNSFFHSFIIRLETWCQVVGKITLAAALIYSKLNDVKRCISKIGEISQNEGNFRFITILVHELF